MQGRALQSEALQGWRAKWREAKEAEAERTRIEKAEQKRAYDAGFAQFYLDCVKGRNGLTEWNLD